MMSARFMICAVIAAGCGISEEPEAVESGQGATPVSALQGSNPEVALAATHTITWDRYSLMIDGQRVFVWSGEFHPFRVPSPSLWRDVLQKLKANGYKVVHMRAKTPLATIAQWDEAAKGEIKGPSGGDKPTSSVVRTIEEAPAQAVTAGAPAPAKK